MSRILLRAVIASALLFSAAVAQTPVPPEPVPPEPVPPEAAPELGDPLAGGRVRLVRDPGGHAGKLRYLVFTPDGKKLVSTAEDRTVQVWDVLTGERLRVLRPPLGKDGAGGLAHSPVIDRQGKRVAFRVQAKNDQGKIVHTIFVCTLATGAARALKGGGPYTFAPDGQSLAIGEEFTVRLVDLATGTARHQFKFAPDRFKHHVTGLAFSPDAKTLAVATGDRVFLLDAATLARGRTLAVPYANLRNVAWADDRTLVCFSGSSKQMLVVIDAGTGKLKHAYAKEVLLTQVPKAKYEPELWVSGVPGTTKAFVRITYNHGGWNDLSCLLDWQTGEATKGYRKESTYGCPAAAVAPDLSIAAQGDGALNDVILFDPKTGKALLQGKAERRLRAAVRGAFGGPASIRWRADGKAVVWRQHNDGPHKGHAELDLTTLTLRPLTDDAFRRVDRELADFAHALDFPPAVGVLPVGATGQPLNLDFETGTLQDWVATGEAFQGQPIKGDTVALRRKGERSGHQGHYWIGGYEKLRDKPQGTLTSVPFKITQPWASFLVGGGASKETRVELVLKDQEKRFFSASGWQENTLRRVVVDLRPHLDKEMFIRLVDVHSGSWGHLDFDDFRFHAKQPGVLTPPSNARERGIVRQRGPLTLTLKWPDLIVTGGPQPIIDKAQGPVWGDSTFAASGRVVSYRYYWNAIQVFDPATGKTDVTPVTRSFILSLAVSPRPACRYLLAGSADQTLTVFDPVAGKVLLTVYPARQDWIAWTPEGYYAATPGGERLMGWHVENGPDQLASFYPAGRFRNKFHRPDVIKLVLEKGSVAEALKAADAARGAKTEALPLEQLLPPQAVLTVLDDSKLPTLKLKATATARTPQQPITALRLLVDGRPLPGGEGYQTFPAQQAKADAIWTVTLPEGKHQLSVLARGPDTASVSAAVEVVNVDPAKQPALHVLAVGVNDYQDASLKLDFAAADATAIAKAFGGGKAGLYRPGTVLTLVNGQARKPAVLAALAGLRQSAKPNDLMVVFFAGHGVKDKSGFYLLTVEADTQALAKTALSGVELRKGLGEFPCQVLLLLDACHSGASIKAFRPVVDDLTRELTDDECGVAVLSAAMASEQAQEKDGHGLFTQAVVEALGQAEGVPFNRHNRLLYVHHLHSFVFDEVARRSGERQHPFLSLPWVVEPFPIRKVK